VTGEDIALELVHVGVPELGGLAVKGRGAAREVSVCSSVEHEGGSLVGLAEQALQGQQDRTDVQDGTPLVLEDVEADAALHVDIGVVDGGGEADLRRHVWVAGREVEAQLERETRVGRVGGTDDGAVPDSEVAVMRKGTDAGRGRCHQCHELALQPVSRVSQLMPILDSTDEPLDDIAIVLGLGGAGGRLRGCSDGSHVDCVGGDETRRLLWMKKLCEWSGGHVRVEMRG
jgi:hypothetical protein